MCSRPSQEAPPSPLPPAAFRSLCVFCGSCAGARPEFAASARELARTLCARNIRLIYGGGSTGLMGILADSVLEGGGRVTGIIPRGLARPGIAHSRIQVMQVVDTMHQRKMQMHQQSDALIALAGGYGTFEELLEAITWVQLGLSPKPVGILNTAGYYDPLLKQFEEARTEGFIAPEFGDLIVSHTVADSLITQLQNRRAPRSDLWIENPSQLP